MKNPSLQPLIAALLAVTFLMSFVACATPETESIAPVGGTLPADVPDDFAIHFEQWIDPNQKNILDTFDGYMQCDLVARGIMTKDFIIPAADLAELYRQVLRIKDIDIPVDDEHLCTGDIGYCVTPLTCYAVTFRMNGQTYTVTGDATAVTHTASSPEAQDFMEVVGYLMRYMQGTDTYASFPEPSGGYD